MEKKNARLTEAKPSAQRQAHSITPNQAATREFHVIPANEFVTTPDVQSNEAADLLRDAAACIECGYLEGATWRTADASLLLRNALERKGLGDIADTPTGRGAILGGGPRHD